MWKIIVSIAIAAIGFYIAATTGRDPGSLVIGMCFGAFAAMSPAYTLGEAIGAIRTTTSYARVLRTIDATLQAEDIERARKLIAKVTEGMQP